MIHVKPYHFFAKTGDINAPPGLTKKDEDNKTGFDFSNGIPVPIRNNNKVPEVVEADSTTAGDSGTYSSTTSESTSGKKEEDDKIDLTDDLFLSDDESETADEETVDSSSDSSSDDDTTESIVSASTPKPGVPHYFDDEDSIQNTPPSLKETEGKADVEADVREGLDQTPELTIPSGSVQRSENSIVEMTTKSKLEVPSSSIQKQKTNTEEEAQKESQGEGSDASSNLPVNEPAASLPKEKDGFIDVDDPDDYLLYLEDVLNRVHKAYFHLYDELVQKKEDKLPDVKEIVPYVRKQILKVRDNY